MAQDGAVAAAVPAATNALDVALPVEVVTLKRLRTKSGEPVRVRVEAVDELVLADATKQLPGDVPPSVERDRLLESMTAEDKVRLMDAVAPALLMAATALDGPEGLVRPAFYWGDSAPHPLSIPGRLLRVEDRMLLVEAVLRVGGYVGGAADAGSFHGEQRSGADAGGGPVGAGPGDGADAVGSTA